MVPFSKVNLHQHSMAGHGPVSFSSKKMMADRQPDHRITMMHRINWAPMAEPA